MFVLQQYQIGLQAMEGRLGSENPKYKALATQMEAMHKAYQKNLVAARAIRLRRSRSPAGGGVCKDFA
jgi:hypothetical protein